MTTFIRETKGDDRDIEVYRGFVLAQCNTRLCARLAEGDWQRKVAEFLEDYFYEQGLRTAISEDRHITGAICCVLMDSKVRGLKRQSETLKRAIDDFWKDFAGDRKIEIPSGREIMRANSEGARA